jgi:hypothetical protein
VFKKVYSKKSVIGIIILKKSREKKKLKKFNKEFQIIFFDKKTRTMERGTWNFTYIRI